MAEQALQSRFNNKADNSKQRKHLAGDENSSKNADSSKKGVGNKYSGSEVDTKEVQCYNCQSFGHYARDCRRKKAARAKESDESQYE